MPPEVRFMENPLSLYISGQTLSKLASLGRCNAPVRVHAALPKLRRPGRCVVGRTVVRVAWHELSVWAENSDLDTYVWISHIMWLWFTIFHGCREMWHFTDSPEWVNSMNSVRNICFRRSFLILKARRPTSMQGDWLVFLSFYIYKSCTQLPHITCYF